MTPSTVSLSGSSVQEGAAVNYVFTATLSNASHGVTTITTDQGDIVIRAEERRGGKEGAAPKGEDVYLDASSLTAEITGVSGGNFENLTTGAAPATAHVSDTSTPSRVSLSGSSVQEGAAVNYVFTATLSNASHGVTTITTDQGDIVI